MKKEGVIILFLILLLPLVSSSVDSEIQKVTHYAEEYEIGNINYPQFLIYLSSSRQKLNEILGAKEKDYGGILKQEQLKSFFGEPTKETKWVWVEGEEREIKLDYEAPVWEKIIFDGNKIQIRLNAYPSLFSKKIIEEEIERIENSENIKGDLKEKLKEEKRKELEKFSANEGSLVYRLHFRTEFKKPEEQLNINSKIIEIQKLAQTFNSDSLDSNAEILAKESVNAEKIFNSYFQQNPGKCENLMASIFGSENLRQTTQTLVYEFVFYEGDNFEAKMRLDMCEDCDWHWINVNMWFEGRGRFKQPQQKDFAVGNLKDYYKNIGTEEFKYEAGELISQMTLALESGNYELALESSNKLQILNEVWNEKSNNLWEQIEKEFQSQESSMTEQERNKLYENYGWITREQNKRVRIKELSTKNYEERKQFYLSLFSGYEKKEYFYEQIEFEKRLVEEFKEFGEEICSNNQDDNKNEKTDCDDSQCSGKFCGTIISTKNVENESVERKVDLYCIAGTCQQKEEIVEVKTTVCGNHICEEGEMPFLNSSEIQITNESGYCFEDCTVCPEYPPIECAGKVIFSGTDENSCPLTPVCLNETEFCEVNEDCADPLCGDSQCVKGTCQVLELTECQEPECLDGQEKIKNCENSEQIISEICMNSLWKITGADCVAIAEEIGTEELIINAEELFADECNVQSDCGGSNDVCSNGRCVTLPQSIEIVEEGSKISEGEETETQEEITSEEETSTETSTTEESESPMTGRVIFNFLKLISGRITGNAITGFDVEGESSAGESSVPAEQSTAEGDSSLGGESKKSTENNFQESDSQEQSEFQQGTQENFEEFHNEEDNREFEERPQRDMKEECEERCSRECYDMEIRPCVDKCIWSECGDDLDCDAKSMTSTCEEKCKEEKDIGACEDECQEKCLKGESTWKEQKQDERKEEKGVFVSGGGCRTSEGKTEAYIWFNGWGEPFERVQPLKYKYYNSGEMDWCKWDLENLQKQRKEFENGFNQEFVIWFFEKYLASSAEDWEQSVSGIFEIYWNDVDNSRELANRMNCLKMKQIPFDYNLINVKYETEYGSLEFWEEVKIVKMPESDEETEVITPYMKVWVFPPKKFIIYEMKKSMVNHEFPGPPEEKMERENEEGMTEEEKMMIKQNENFMKGISKISSKYGGSFDGIVQFKDYETNEIVFNLYAQINEEDIVKFKPMLPEEVTDYDAKAEIDFELLYDIILTSEKEMQGIRTESPPWDKRGIKPIEKFNEIKNGIKMFLKIRKMVNSAEVIPSDAKEDVQNLFNMFVKLMMQGGGNENGNKEMNNKNMEGNSGVENSGEEKLSGDVILVSR